MGGEGMSGRAAAMIGGTEGVGVEEVEEVEGGLYRCVVRSPALQKCGVSCV